MFGLPDAETMEEFVDLYRRLVEAMERMVELLEGQLYEEEEEEEDVSE